MKKQIPNILSALRIVMVGGFVGMFVTGQYLAALFVYVSAFLTDILDGWLARRNGWITDLGKLLDPLADKLMTLAALCCIAAGAGQTCLWIALFFAVLKESVMVLGSMLLLERRTVVSSDVFGKIATGLYGAGIVLSLTGFAAYRKPGIGMEMLLAATAASYLAMLHYALVFFGRNRAKKPVSSE